MIIIAQYYNRNKWVERALIWGGGIIGACILASLMALILK